MPELLTADVVVVGGGPAGSAAAIVAGRAGLRVVVIDKAEFPRDKCCGDGLTAGALRRIQELGLNPADVDSWEPVEDVTVVSSDGHPVELPLPRPGLFAASARRADLDHALLDLARQAGAVVVQGRAVTGAHLTRRGVALDLEDGGTALAYYAVGADGMWSPLRKALGLGDQGYLGDWQAGRQYYGNVGPQARRLWVWFEPDMVPGYAWSFPLPGGTANVGYGVIRAPGGARSELRGQRIDLLERPHIAAVLGPDAAPSGPWKAWPIPTGIGGVSHHGLNGRVLFAGDAARACDPMTGEGIAQALETGETVARAIVEAGPRRPGRAARRYDRQIRWGMALDDRLAQALSQVLAHPTGSIRSLGLVDANDWCRRNFVRWMFEDYPRAALVTPHRWRRKMFSTPGAY